MAELEREVMIDASPETVFGFLIEPELFAQWAGSDPEMDVRPGGVFSATYGGSHRASGEFVEIVPNERVVYTFGWEAEENPIRPGSSTVEVTLEAEGAKTRLRLRHHGLPDDAVGDHTEGWTHYLDRLVVAGGGGDPGPDRMAEM
jgi:uncharacterized protein YndB with AHSA1/START domain